MDCFDRKDQLIPHTKIEKIMINNIRIDKYDSEPRIDAQALEVMQEILTEFICFVTADMAEEVQKERRVALKGQDLIESLNRLGFGHYTGVLDALLPRVM
ncbi:UNKNOWN [Stylonychia lemnae]|uniref:Transcription factor CBF/NF-Y/archaeal histone domain-containing protein n=1 Tax=Stylonychia lemnae TaxID=5949 RepID=A0A078B142_STYLE|nr:UNKNOWN [Stylonychia lemnae]|eukprot:CDW87077.1 UNKNOWN [Stylonychia lemnae]